MTSPPALPPRSPRAVALGLLAVALVLSHGLAAPTSVQPGDSGELATVLLRGGVPHPPGYPWMRALGLLARPLARAGVTPMWAAAAPSALAGVAAWLWIAASARRWALAWTAPLFVAICALSPLSLRHVPDAEVWGLHLLLCALLVIAALTPQPQGRPAWRRPARIGLLLGLAVSHHQTAALLAPLAVGAAWPTRPPRLAPALLRAAGLGLLGAAAGLTPLLTLMIGRGGAWRWGDTTSLSGWLHHVTRADYGAFSLSLQHLSPPVHLLLGRAAAGVMEPLTAGLVASPLGATLAVAIFAPAALWARPAPLRLAAWRGLVASFLLSSLGFATLQNLDPRSPFSGWILERFDLLPLLLAAPMAAAITARLATLMRPRAARAAWLAAAAVLPAVQALRAFGGSLPAHEVQVERYGRQILASPSPDGPRPSLVFGADDHRTFPTLYLQAVLNLAPGVLYIDASLLSQPWYRAWLRRRWPTLPELDRPVRLISYLWLDAAQRDRPIYLTHPFSRPAAELLHLEPEGALWRVIPPHLEDAPQAASLPAVAARHRAALRRLRAAGVGLTRAAPDADDPWAAEVTAAALEPTLALLERLRAAGRPAEVNALSAALTP